MLLGKIFDFISVFDFISIDCFNICQLSSMIFIIVINFKNIFSLYFPHISWFVDDSLKFLAIESQIESLDEKVASMHNI